MMPCRPNQADEATTILMYSDDIVGLGHLRRNVNIASRLVQELPKSNVLLLTGLPSGCLFEVPDRVDYIKLPSVTKIDTGVYEPRSLSVNGTIVKSLRAETIRVVAKEFSPQLFLVDHMPLGIWGELLPTLRMLKARPSPARVVLGLRDILDAPAVTRRLWAESGVYPAIESLYDSVLIYGSKTLFNTGAHYGLDDHLTTKIEYCGYVCRDGLRPDNTGSDTPDKRLVVATAGGGFDGYPLMELCIQAIRQFGPNTSCELLCITGPFMQPEHRHALLALAEGLSVRFIESTADPTMYFRSADLIVAMAGYNTLIEAIQLRKNVLVMPRRGPSAEQSIRADIFEGLGLVKTISSDQALPATLAKLIAARMQPLRSKEPNLDMGGLDTATHALLALLEEGTDARLRAV